MKTELNSKGCRLRFSLRRGHAFGLLLVASIFCATPPLAAQPSSPGTVQKSIAKALPFIKEKGQSWIENKGCVSCHRTSFMTWSLIQAGNADIDIQTEQLSDWLDWNYDQLLSEVAENPKHDGEQVVERNLSGGGQMLALARRWNFTDTQREAQRRIVDILIDAQQDNGTWEPKGQLPL